MKNWQMMLKPLFWTFLIIGLACAGAATFWYLTRVKTDSSHTIPSQSFQHQARVEKSTIPIRAEVVGNIVPALHSILSAEISGQVKAVSVSEGDPIPLGQVLADIDDAQYALELAQARQQQDSLEPLFKDALAQYQRTDRLFKKEAATLVQWEKAKAAYENAEANYNGAQKNTQRLLVRFEKTKITSPYKGIVAKKFIDPGDLIVPGKQLFLIYADGPLEIHAEVPEKLISFLHVGSKVAIDVGAFHLKTKGVVAEIIPYANPQSHTYLVKATLENSGKILPQSYGRMTFSTGYQKAVLIPGKAIQKIGQLEIVCVLENEVWVRRYIRTGRQINGKVEVLSGLSEGEIIGYD